MRFQTIAQETDCIAGPQTRRRPERPAKFFRHCAPAQFAVGRHEGEKHEPNGGEMPKPGQIVGAVRIDNGNGVGKFLVGLMVVDHHGIETEPFRFSERFEARNATIDSDQQFCTALGE